MASAKARASASVIDFAFTYVDFSSTAGHGTVVRYILSQVRPVTYGAAPGALTRV